MSADKEKNLDEFMKKMVKEVGTEEPSSHFTDSVMDKIYALEKEAAGLRYVPPISKNTWILIGVVVLIVCAILLNTSWETQLGMLSSPITDYLPSIKLGELFNSFNLNRIDNISIHKNVVYSILILSIFLSAQIFLLKRRAT